ncbi:unnamed protein product, partial [Prorocentrum cordatum]
SRPRRSRPSLPSARSGRGAGPPSAARRARPAGEGFGRHGAARREHGVLVPDLRVPHAAGRGAGGRGPPTLVPTERRRPRREQGFAAPACRGARGARGPQLVRVPARGRQRGRPPEDHRGRRGRVGARCARG